MASSSLDERGAISWCRRAFGANALRWIALLGLCSAYLQGGIVKAVDYAGAVAEMHHFGLAPAGPLVIVTILIELIAPLLILSGVYRWLGAIVLAGFTVVATMLANRFWEAGSPDRLALANAFFEHLGLVGGFLLVAWYDLTHDTSRHDFKRAR